MIVIAYTSEELPLTVDEKKRLYDVITSIVSVKRINLTFAKGTDCEAKREIALQIIGISPIKQTEDDEDV